MRTNRTLRDWVDTIILTVCLYTAMRLVSDKPFGENDWKAIGAAVLIYIAIDTAIDRYHRFNWRIERYRRELRDGEA